MRFFSNDARESGSDPADDEQGSETRTPDARTTDTADADERPDHVQSAPVAVPHQRPPSPWSNRPPAADEPAAAGADRRDGVPVAGADRRDGVPVAGADDVPGRADDDPPPFHEPSPQPTAGGAVASSATANPANDRWDATDRDSAAGDDADRAPGDGVVTSSTNAHAAGTGSVPDTVPANWSQRGDDRHDPDDIVDVPLDDTATTSTDASGRDGEGATSDEPTTAGSGSLEDDGDFDDPKAVDPATGTPLEALGDDAEVPPVVAVPVAPAAAAEAVEKLTASLRSQRDGFAEDTEDTEKLRVQLRGYREILNRILNL